MHDQQVCIGQLRFKSKYFVQRNQQIPSEISVNYNKEIIYKQKFLSFIQ